MANPNMIDALRALGLFDLPPDWVSQIWDSNFVDTADSWPIDFSPPDIALDALSTLQNDFFSWSTKDNADCFWTKLVEHDISIRTLLPLLHGFMDSSADRPEAASIAAAVYCTLLAVPGAAAHAVFAPMVMRTVVKILDMTANGTNSTLAISPIKPSGSKRQASSPPKAPNASKRRAGEGNAAKETTRTPIHVATTLLQAFVYALRSGIHNNCADLTDDIIQTVVALTRMPQTAPTSMPLPEFLTALQMSPEEHIAACDNISHLAFAGLDALSAASAATSDSVGTRIFRALIPSMTMRYRSVVTNGAAIPKAVHAVRAQTTAFVIHVAATHAQCLPAVHLLVQHTCMRVPDKAEYRCNAAVSVATLVAAVMRHDAPRGHALCTWFAKLSRNAKVGYRHFALEIMQLLLTNFSHGAEFVDVDATAAEAVTTGIDAVTGAHVASTATHAQAFLDIAISRASDKAATVRAKALAVLGGLFDSVAAPTHDPAATNVAYAAALHDEIQTRLGLCDTPPAASHPDGADGLVLHRAINSSLFSLFIRRCHDDKGGVRKAALVVLQALAPVLGAGRVVSDASYLPTIQRACMDVAVSVRKQAVVCMTHVLQLHPTHAPIQIRWLDAVMPLVLDSEDSVRTKVVELLQLRLLDPVATHEDTPMTRLGWELLDRVDEKQDLRRYLQRACALWERNGSLRQSLYTNLTRHLSDPSAVGGWSLLCEMASRKPALVDADVITRAWARPAVHDSIIAGPLLSTLGCIAPRLTATFRTAFVAGVRDLLAQFTVPVSTVSGMLDACVQMLRAENSTPPSAAIPPAALDLLTDLLRLCEQGLSAVAFSDKRDAVDDEVLFSRMLFTFGEAALVCPRAVTRRHILILHAIVAPGMAPANGNTDGNTNATDGNTDATDGNTVCGTPPRRTYPPSARAHAFLALGKLCLQNESLAKETIASMAHELDVCTDPAVRNNIVVVMTDLCVRHPNVIQQYLPHIQMCLRDPTALVRRQTITLLTRLLKEDFIKLRPDLLFRLLMTTVDADAGVKELARFCIVNILCVKDKHILAASFVEAVFHFNSVTDHVIYNRFPRSDKADTLFTLAGDANRSRRRMLYKLMLSNCGDVERLQLTQKLCQEVLGAVADESLKFASPAAMAAVVGDTLDILASADIKVEARAGAGDDDDDARVAATAKAKAAMVSKIVRKNVAENIVPIVIGLKVFLERKRSPLMKHLMLYLRELMKDYKEEVSDILAADRQLANEIEFDLQKFEEEQRAAEQERKEGTPVSVLGRATPSTPLLFRGVTPGGMSPLLSPSLFGSISSRTNGTPGTPAFAAPKLRASVVATATGRHRAARTSSVGATHGGAGATGLVTPVGGVAVARRGSSLRTSGTPVGTTPRVDSPHAARLSWVRTPAGASSRAGTDAALSTSIRLPTPNGVSVASTLRSTAAPSPNLRPPVFPPADTYADNKRHRDGDADGHGVVDDAVTPDAGSEGADENDGNALNTVRDAGEPPLKRMQLSKAQLRRRNVEISKLSVEITEGKMLLEELVGQERFFDADALKAKIGTLEQRKHELQV
eukprot:m.1264576 g.1264576  ORF g.1264576 m.1264576 type:complete len:1558 (+) comp24735_c0_seq11:92-4765(+)